MELILVAEISSDYTDNGCFSLGVDELFCV
jgi:hypothetical protein